MQQTTTHEIFNDSCKKYNAALFKDEVLELLRNEIIKSDDPRATMRLGELFVAISQLQVAG